MRHTAPDGGTRVVLLVGTQKGLFRLESDPHRETWRMEGPLIAGYEITHAWLDPRRPGRGYAAANHLIWGAHVYRTDDDGRHWEPLPQPPMHPVGEHDSALRAVWHLAPGPADDPDMLYAGIDPAGLFFSTDAGNHWAGVDALNHHSTRAQWEPAKGGFFVHSIQVAADHPRRLFAAVSAGGAYRSDDAGATWQPINRGVRAEHLPEECPHTGHNIHRLVAHPRNSDRLYRQCYNGVYRSDDAGDSWTEISAGLPSDFGYVAVTERDAPDSLYVIPIDSNHLRTAVDGRLRVYRTGDAGASWTPLTDGLPQQHAYVTVLRDAMAVDDLPECGVYFGTSSGHLFASRNRGENWQPLTAFLPRILSVQARVVPEGDQK
ncbi:hypothetical protein HC341_05690 [Aquisalimonas sp. 2447]|uniref:WD40/YVTN/BNR-like repeat-containing protein n=1 Tax=Aquisalimonas sp. 2447 TaxID=2740807 RepID=UPI0014324C68|nr:hypothetical protein [Aquisalimonas sp. 2447]QIT54752.1 hypothetical protein HC341_05690 [Aquisalimonas sp. 2447]